jgi:short-subunit dehydrogenase
VTEPDDLAGRAVLVTGASSGIGAATARLLAARGATVGLIGRRADRLAAVLADCREQAPGSHGWVADLGDLDRAEALVDEAWDRFGQLDILINNAAVPKVRPVTVMRADDIEEAMRINFFSPARMTLRVLPKMLARREGCIVNVGSVGGRLGVAHEAAYSASKFALTGWSEAIAIDLDGTGVRVRLVHPGPIDTDIWDRPGEPHAVYDGPKFPADDVADGILAAIASDHFEHYLPDLKAVVTGKDANIDAYLKAAASLVGNRS